MKKTYQNLIIGGLILLVIAFIFAWTAYFKQNSTKIIIPDISKIYTIEDFSDSSLDEESLQNLIKRLNNDQKYLREGTYESEVQRYDIWVDIANLKFALEDYDSAVEIWEYAITLNNSNPLAFANLANYYKSFANDYEKAAYYYDQAIQKDNVGYYFDYEAYAELYIRYLPEDPHRVEIIMLDGVAKAVGNTKLNFYLFLYNYWNEKGDSNKTAQYKDEILKIDANYQF
ncbi:MAG: hypothetical protein WCS88_00385 [Patescibacteria group bacterium]|jgi:tetratricopeptide (TPR) repeat protein